MSDYLALINVNGLGSWARGPDKEQTIKRVIGMFHGDFKSILKPESKKPKIKIKVYDLANYDQVWWDEYGLYDGDDKHIDAKAEIIEHTYSSW